MLIIESEGDGPTGSVILVWKGRSGYRRTGIVSGKCQDIINKGFIMQYMTPTVRR